MSKSTLTASQPTSNFERYVTFEMTSLKTLPRPYICSLIDGRLDYCNALLYGTSAANIHTIQRVQNSMARAVTNSRRTEHNIKQALASLHGCQANIEYNIKSLSARLKCKQPKHWAICRKWSGVIPHNATVNSATATAYSKIGSNELAERAFCRAAPAVWNS